MLLLWTIWSQAEQLPFDKPPEEATGHNRTTNAIISAQPQANSGNQQWFLHANNQPQPHTVGTEFLCMSQAYQSADITTVTGVVGPLYYATVIVQGITVQALMDPGSSATIMSFQLFCKIGQAAHIPASALQKPDILLRDYSQMPIIVGACVHLTILIQDLSVTTPVYLYPNDSAHPEQCLLSINVVILLINFDDTTY